MTPEEAKAKYAAAEKATDSLLVRVAESPATLVILAVVAIAAFITIIVVVP